MNAPITPTNPNVPVGLSMPSSTAVLAPYPAPIIPASPDMPIDHHPLETPDFTDGGWTYTGPPQCTKAEENKANKEQ
jgi:hypothetical protein